VSILPDSPSCPSAFCWEEAERPQISNAQLRIDSETHLRVDVRHDTTLGNNDIAKELVQPLEILKQEKNRDSLFDSLLIISDGKL
jgi:hypothetical protein